MTFTNKNLQSHRSGMTFLKGATFFFLGMSLVMFMTKAFEVVPSTRNTSMFLRSISLTTDGDSSSSAGITLDGNSGNAIFGGIVTGATFCLSGDDCITEWPEGTPAGNAKAIQYNGSGGLFSGSTDFTRDSSLKELYVNGTGKFTNIEATIIKANYDINVNGDINANLNVNVGGTVNATSIDATNIDIKGSTDMLGSIITNNSMTGYTSSMFLPGLTGLTEDNDARDTDSIWYISCVSGSNTGVNLMMLGFTGEHLGVLDGYFVMPIMGLSTLTYHLPKGETAWIGKSNFCNTYIAYSQKYGGTGTVSSGGDPIWLSEEQEHVIEASGGL